MTRPINGLSHVKGSTKRPLIHATIPGFMAEVRKRHGHRMATVFSQTGERWTYEDLMRRVDRLAAGLLSIGVYKGDRVGIWSPNRPEWVLTQFATARIGAILVNINPAYQTLELEYALRHAGVSTLITAAQFRESDYLGKLRDLAPELATAQTGHLHSKKLPKLRRIVQIGSDPMAGAISFDEVMTRGNAAPKARLDGISAALKPGDAINIQFTSGTTGHPKGATLSHFNIINNAISTARTMQLTPDDALCIPVPLYHCFGMVLGNLAAASYGVKMVFPSEGFDPLATLKAVEAEGCTALHGVPTMFVAMLDHPEFARFDLRRLRTGVMAGSLCPASLMARVMKDMHCSGITIGYGMTETSPISFQSDPGDPPARRVSTVGRIQPHVECRVVDDAGRTLPVGHQGQLLTRGYLVMKGYWNDPEFTAHAIHDGWMHTGDLATIDAEGYCQITGRAGDMLIRGGENIYPAEVEDLLLTHPDIAQVQVFGLPDARLGEEVAAWIILRPNADLTATGLQDWCREKIARFKVPRHIRFADEMPVTATGKPQKFKMQEAMCAELGIALPT
ncbi:AMP-binding protein [Planktomarina temperata]|jgi:fatty-acyl-CoA synthase|nr:AMP-binding protein [Yoonia sp.]MDA9995200.1 AMP-binding protein [Planktomarina temperata]MDB4854605.1 AMP-binding protein [Planktomarina temperata]MDC0639832.1 AMP-binding protein [Planktomarina temperata]